MIPPKIENKKKTYNMRRVLFTALVLIGAFTAQAQTETESKETETETSIRTQAKQYARSILR